MGFLSKLETIILEFEFVISLVEIFVQLNIKGALLSQK